jgi:CheY-like chemotaxis protein
MKHVVDGERAIAAQKGLELRLRDTTASVLSDPALLERMLKNLVINAIRYTDRGRILVGCRRVGPSRVRIDVIDSGIGIALEEQERIFEEYYQLSGNSAQGLGLGLPIVRSLGELLGHRVSVRSAAGSGSAFSIELPRASEVPARVLALAAPAASLPPLNVALVDDDAEIRRSMSLLLESWGCRAVAAGTVAELEERLRAENLVPDALIVDYRLAGTMDGLQVMERLRRHFRRDLPTLVISGNANPAQLQGRAPGVPFAMKPVAPGRLRAFLSQALSNA